METLVLTNENYNQAPFDMGHDSVLDCKMPVLKENIELDTSNVTDMSGMFRRCRTLRVMPQLDTSKVTNMSDMFVNCKCLRTIDVV